MCLVADNSECGTAFTSREDLEHAVGLYLAIEGGTLQQNSPRKTQLLFPNIQFTCSGTINSLIVAVAPAVRGDAFLPEIQVWRLDENSTTYSKVDSVQLSTDLIPILSAEAQVYRLNVSLSFSTGDILGVFYAQQSHIQLLSLAGHGSELISKSQSFQPPPDSLQNTSPATGRQWPLIALSEGEGLWCA